MASRPTAVGSRESRKGTAAFDTHGRWIGQLLGSNMEENLEPTLVWIQGKLLLDDAGLCKLVEKHPSFLGFSLESHKERVSWLQKKAGC